MHPGGSSPSLHEAAGELVLAGSLHWLPNLRHHIEPAASRALERDANHKAEAGATATGLEFGHDCLIS